MPRLKGPWWPTHDLILGLFFSMQPRPPSFVLNGQHSSVNAEAAKCLTRPSLRVHSSTLHWSNRVRDHPRSKRCGARPHSSWDEVTFQRDRHTAMGDLWPHFPSATIHQYIMMQWFFFFFFFFTFETGSCYVAQADFVLKILLPQSPESLGHNDSTYKK
jgi:hypothetical protein